MACTVPWVPDTSCDPGWVDYPPEIQDRATALAWDTLRLLTAGQVGHCVTEDRPCLAHLCGICDTGWMFPVLRDGEWFNAACGTMGCTCCAVYEVLMPSSIAYLLDVWVDGVEMPEGSYRVDASNRLVRVDGLPWPSCAPADAAASDPGSFVVRYVPGIAPGPGGMAAAGVLASEYAKACSGGKCRLPSNVTAITRQGVTQTLVGGMFAGGSTGIREVDAWVASVNPHHLTVPPQVWSPDIVQHRYTPVPLVVGP